MTVLDNIKQGKYLPKAIVPDSTLRTTDPAAHQAEMRKCAEEAIRCNDLFKSDLEAEFNMQNHPNKTQLYFQVCISCHNVSREDIYHSYKELAQKLKKSC